MKKHKFKLAMGLTVTFSAMTLLAVQSTHSQSYCANHNSVDYNQMLPSNHPVNRCSSQAKQVNWGSWLTGDSDSNQFHFFDLFELLHSGRDHQIPQNSDSIPTQ
ncbi:hypothetical protein [Parashewanella tropica]|uniref:hypothetical protein n=1 Tax=Parashewanella tropica TaxID=2547970 RepID=UPI001FE4530E|nr:hypothetical protein [Parashewanella tropica]